MRRFGWRWGFVFVMAGFDLEEVGGRRQQKKYSPPNRMGRAADDPIEIPRMACLDSPDVSPPPEVLFVLLLSLLLLLVLSLLLPLVVPPGLLLPEDPPRPGVASYMSVMSFTEGPHEGSAHVLTY